MNNAWWTSFVTALKLGLTSFGGPTAHIGFFREEYVVRKRWIDDAGFADLNALCQLLPGPASSQVGIGVGYRRAGLLGAAMAWLGFTLPSALGMALFAYLYSSLSATLHAGWLHGLELAAVAIVAGALLGMAKSLAPDRSRATIAVLSAAVVLLVDQAAAQLAVMGVAAAAGMYLHSKEANGAYTGAAAQAEAAEAPDAAETATAARKRLGWLCLALFAVLLLGLPVVSAAAEFKPLLLFESFYRSGALVFGGGHVVLPLLERETVQAGWITQQQFVAGYGAVQAMPGPLFTFASYLGAAAAGWQGAVLATIAVFLPGFLLVVGVLPFWSSWQRFRLVRGAIYGINAAVVGILLAALYDPLFTGAVKGGVDFAFLAVLYVLMSRWKLPPWALVIVAAAGGWAVYGAPFENVSIN